MELKKFQQCAIAELNAAMAKPDKRDIVLKSPTGSGKTIILTRFMAEYMKDHAGVAFVWLTPGKGELEEQSKKKMDAYCHNASTKDLADVMTGGFAAGDAVFINWEKLTKKGSNALKDSERTNFIEWTQKALNEGVSFKVIVDESHQNFTEKADAIVELLTDLEKGNLNDILYGVAIDTHRHGRDFHHEVGEIGYGCALPYEDVLPIIRRLFADEPSDAGKVLELKPKALYAFVINNADKLKEDFRAAMAAELDLQTEGEKVSQKTFHIPHEWVCTYDGKAKVQGAAAKNVYKDYPTSARPRSTGEIKFEKWCEQTESVEWFYRNGDKGDEYFSIVYADNAGRQKLFYPDYVLSVGGETWIIEVKGGFNASGESENIDIYAPKKAEALRMYCAKYHLRGGFVCYAESEDEIFLSEDGFSEDIHDPCWKLLKDVVEK